IPADMVVNAMIVAMVTHANQTSHQFIYHVGSSLKNPFNPNVFADYVYHYFTKNPVISKEGNRIRVKKVTVLPSMDSFVTYMKVHYIIPLKVFEFLSLLLCNYFHQGCGITNKKIKLVMSLVELYAPYILFKGIFDDLNTERLRIAISTSEAETFYFDPKCIEWDDYFIHKHLPGVVKYNLK
ncbi:Fatty acyl-coa reductase, partial [Thalictrum thalictroides]